ARAPRRSPARPRRRSPALPPGSFSRRRPRASSRGGAGAWAYINPERPDQENFRSKGGPRVPIRRIMKSWALAWAIALAGPAACAMAFQTSDGSAQFPRNKEAARFDKLVKAITSDAGVLSGWNGDDLLFSGVSHGASGPVVTMATSNDDDQPAWKGARYTAAC